MNTEPADKSSKNGIRKSDHVVFLLGAGASVDYGLPVMNRFMDVAHQRYFHYRERAAAHRIELVGSYYEMLAFHQQCNRSASRIKINWDNIEELYTQADLRRLAHIPNKRDAEALCRHIAWGIWDIYRCAPSNFTHTKHLPRNLAKSVRNVISASCIPAVITTNYDVCVERALSNTRGSEPIPFVYPGFLEDRGRPDIPLRQYCVPICPFNSDTPTTKVVKLHGSVSWFFSEESDQGYVAVDTYGHGSIWDVDNPDLNYEHFLKLLVDNHFSLTKGIRPAIIPGPTHHRPPALFAVP